MRQLLMLLVTFILLSGCATQYTPVKARFNFLLVDSLPITEQAKQTKRELQYQNRSSFYTHTFNDKSLLDTIINGDEQDNLYITGYFENFYFPFLYCSAEFKGQIIELSPIQSRVD